MQPITSDALIIGVDTHKDVYVAVAISGLGARLGALSISATTAGFCQLLERGRAHGPVEAFGIEGTGSYGAGLSRALIAQGCRVIEVNRPNRQLRRQRGKSDTIDAEAAARAVLAGQTDTSPKSADGEVEMIRHLKIARDTALKSRTQAMCHAQDPHRQRASTASRTVLRHDRANDSDSNAGGTSKPLSTFSRQVHFFDTALQAGNWVAVMFEVQEGPRSAPRPCCFRGIVMLCRALLFFATLVLPTSHGLSQTLLDSESISRQRILRDRAEDPTQSRRSRDERQLDRLIRQRERTLRRFDQSVQPSQRSAPVLRRGSRDRVVRTE